MKSACDADRPTTGPTPRPPAVAARRVQPIAPPAAVRPARDIPPA